MNLERKAPQKSTVAFVIFTAPSKGELFDVLAGVREGVHSLVSAAPAVWRSSLGSSSLYKIRTVVASSLYLPAEVLFPPGSIL